MLCWVWKGSEHEICRGLKTSLIEDVDSLLELWQVNTGKKVISRKGVLEDQGFEKEVLGVAVSVEPGEGGYKRG